MCVCVCVYTYAHNIPTVCVYTYTHIHIHTYTYIQHIHKHINAHTYIHTQRDTYTNILRFRARVFNTCARVSNTAATSATGKHFAFSKTCIQILGRSREHAFDQG